MSGYIHPNSRQFFAFNIWSIESAKGILDGAAQAGHDVILQTSPKAFAALDREELRQFVTSYGAKQGVRAYLHLDHCTDMEGIREAIRCGWDSVMLDASRAPLEENIRLTCQVCAAARKKNVLVEAEVGQIGGASDETEGTQTGVARLEDVERFLQETDVDMLAVAIGTAHGLYQGPPQLHFELLEQTGEISPVPLVIHGGTGLAEETFLRLLSHCNVKKINISTEVKLAYRAGIESSLRQGFLEPAGFDPLRVTAQIHDAVRDMAVKKLELLTGGQKS